MVLILINGVEILKMSIAKLAHHPQRYIYHLKVKKNTKKFQRISKLTKRIDFRSLKIHLVENMF